MAAPKGNDYWKRALNIGKKASYTPEGLKREAEKYIEDVINNPFYKNEAVKSGDSAGLIISIPMCRPLTIHGFCVFAGITTQTFYHYEKQEEYSDIITRIREIFYAQKFEGAAVGAFNPNIIARDLGLTDKIDHTTGGDKLNATPPVINVFNTGPTLASDESEIEDKPKE
jgi:hypothetical protein